MTTLELNLNEKQLSKLKKKFSKLTSIDDKLEFWQHELKRNYVFFDKYTYQEISLFIIKPNSTDETYQLNKWLLENAILAYQNSKAKIYKSYEKMVSDFEHKIKDTKNIKNLIAYELDSVKTICEENSKPKNALDSRSDFFKSGFENFFFHDLKPELSTRKIYEVDNLLALNFGYNLAKFRKYLEELSDKQSSESIEKRKKLNIREKLFLLDYLGVLDNLDTANTKIAILLAYLFDKHTQSVRQELTDFHKNRNPNSKSEKNKLKKDLETILEIFNEIGDKKRLKKLKSDIEKVDV